MDNDIPRSLMQVISYLPGVVCCVQQEDGGVDAIDYVLREEALHCHCHAPARAVVKFISSILSTRTTNCTRSMHFATGSTRNREEPDAPR